MRSTWKTVPDSSKTITIKQNVQFQVGIYHEKFPLDQNGRPAATFDYNMHKNWKTVPHSWTITIEQNVWFQEGIYCGNFNLIKFKIADLRSLLT